MRTYRLTAIADGKELKINGYNEGFSACEIAMILDLKRRDIINQMMGSDAIKFTRTCVVDGKTYNISEIKGEEK